MKKIVLSVLFVGVSVFSVSALAKDNKNISAIQMKENMLKKISHKIDNLEKTKLCITNVQVDENQTKEEIKKTKKTLKDCKKSRTKKSKKMINDKK